MNFSGYTPMFMNSEENSIGKIDIKGGAKGRSVALSLALLTQSFVM